MKPSKTLTAYITAVDAAKPGHHTVDTTRWNAPEMRFCRFCCSHGYSPADCATTIKFMNNNGYESSVTPARASSISTNVAHLHGVLAAFFYIQ